MSQGARNTLRGGAWSAVTAAVMLVVAGCGGGSSPVRSPGRAAAAPSPPQPSRSATVVNGVAVTQCDGTENGGTLPPAPTQVALPSRITVPQGDTVFGTTVTMSWDRFSGDSTARTGQVYMIGRPGATSVGCYQTPNTPSGGAEMVIQPDNGVYSEGAEIVPAGGPASQGVCTNGGTSPAPCGDVADAAPTRTVPTGVPSVTAQIFSVQPDALPENGFFGETVGTDNSHAIVELAVQNQNPGRGDHPAGFSGVAACELDSTADCLAALPYFLAQAAAGSPMTSDDYTQADAQITALVDASA